MLSPKEKRFLKYWEEQKAGGKWYYIIVYTIGWSFILFFIPLATVVFVNMLNFIRFDMLPLWVAILLAIAIGFGIAFYLWEKNEKRAKELPGEETKTGA